MINKGILLEEIIKWSKKYDFNLQIWDGNNSCYIEKDDVEIHSIGGYESVEELLADVLEWIYRVNRTPVNEQVFNVNPYY